MLWLDRDYIVGLTEAPEVAPLDLKFGTDMRREDLNTEFKALRA